MKTLKMAAWTAERSQSHSKICPNCQFIPPRNKQPREKWKHFFSAEKNFDVAFFFVTKMTK